MPDQIRVALLDNHPLFRRGIIDAFSGTRLVVVAEGTPITASSDQDDISEALRIGVHGYILKGVKAAELITALEGIHEGELAPAGQGTIFPIQ